MTALFRLAACVVLALAAQGTVVPAGAAPAAQAASPADEGAPRAPQSRAGRALVGRWESDSSAPSEATPGVLELHGDGRLRLAPQGFEPAHGSWRVHPKARRLALTVPGVGTASMGYTLSGRSLVLHYADGSTQAFVRVPEPGTPHLRKDSRP